MSTRRLAYDLDEEPPAPVRVVLALGGNLGDRAATLQSAVDALGGFEGLRVDQTSPVYESVAVGLTDQPEYLNAVLLARTTLSPLGLLAVCQRVETEHGRRRVVRWGPRTLDVDLITYDGLVAAAADLELPHPRAGERAFVLAPWAALDPDAVLPGPAGPQPVADLLAHAPDAGGLHRREDLTLRPPS